MDNDDMMVPQDDELETDADLEDEDEATDDSNPEEKEGESW